MTNKTNIDEKLQNLGAAIGSDKKLVENVMSRINTKPHSSQLETVVQHIWSNIMKSPLTKLAAVVVITLAVVFPITNFNNSIPSAYAMTDVSNLFRSASVIHVKGLLHFEFTDNGEQVSPQPVERWIDLKNNRFDFSNIAFIAGPEEVKFTITETILDGKYKLVLNHTEKTAVFYNLSNIQQKLETDARLNDLFSGYLLPDFDILKEFSKTGTEEINGINYDIWESERQLSAEYMAEGAEGMAVARMERYKYWLSNDGQSGKLQSWYKNIIQKMLYSGENGEQYLLYQPPWRLGEDYHTIECNVEIPEGVFSLEIPEGYIAKNTKETAYLQELNAQKEHSLSNLRIGHPISFTLNDGSVILAWWSQDSEATTSRKELFENLEFGGSLPKLPIEIYELKSDSHTYFGHHIAYTEKDEKFIEWSLYVSDNPVSNLNLISGYDAQFEYNIETIPRAEIYFMVDYGIFIQTSEDFDKWILGAMAELSDDGKAPEGMVYEKILRLAQQIRESLVK